MWHFTMCQFFWNPSKESTARRAGLVPCAACTVTFSEKSGVVRGLLLSVGSFSALTTPGLGSTHMDTFRHTYLIE